MAKNTKTGEKAKMLFQNPKGMHDILPDEQSFWGKIRRAADKIAAGYNFLRIDTPILESAEIFERSGELTDIVEKQMYYVKNRSGERLVLRPEGTASIMRAYLQHGLSKISQPLKLFYFGPMFRREQPQLGRFRQFYQIGFEILGNEDNPIYDAQAILAAFRLIEELKIKKLIIQINSIGCQKCRSAYVRKLQDHYKDKKNKICKDCQRRLAVRPLRLLDCKNETCLPLKSGSPIILDRLCQSCKEHFKKVLEYLDELSLPYSLNPYLVRGLDYYNKTVFEMFGENVDFALSSGGRYDDLSAMLGGRAVFGVGVSLGVERLVETMKTSGIIKAPKSEPLVFLIHIGEEAKRKALKIFEELRVNGIKTLESFGRQSLKSQIRIADKEKAVLSLILGQKEVFEETIIIRNMKTGAQETAPLNKIVEKVKKRLK